MLKIDAVIDNKVVQNVVVWTLVYLLLLLVLHTDTVLLDSLVILLLMMPFVYFQNIVVIPLFYKGNILKAILFVVLNLLAFIGITSIFLMQLVEFDISLLFDMLGAGLFVLSFASASKLARDSIERRQKAKDAELKLLKGQLNPHFLFNTLNNLYGLSVVKSDKLPKLMLKLSDLLRYSLYETKSKFVPLVKEIEYLENYISLERIRLEDKAEIGFTKDIKAEHLIPPMLLIVFVENAFKHLGQTADDLESVNIELSSADQNILFTCTNTINAQQNGLEKKNGGIGLANVRKRLKLIYPNNHDVSVVKNDQQYQVNLSISLP